LRCSRTDPGPDPDGGPDPWAARNLDIRDIVYDIALGDEAYGVSIHNEIRRRARRDVTVAAVYKTLERLENKGLAVSALGEPTAERGGRRKKYFRIQPAGRRALTAAISSLWRMTHGLPGEFDFGVK
jgi:DNA-binding PadR family transcriptional regulator